MRRTLTLWIVAGFVTTIVVSACVGQYKSDFPVVVSNDAANAIQVLANGNEIGQVAAGQTGSFGLRLAEINSNAFTNGVAPTPQAQVTFTARDLKTGNLSTTKSMTLAQNAPTYVTFGAADFSVSATVARFTFSPAVPGANDEVSFNASSSTVSAGSFAWDFGDGGTGAGVTATHQYGRAATFTITLTITSDTGQSSTASRTITVSTAFSPVVARFTFSPTAPDVTQDVFFNAWTSTPSDGTFTWTFGDGSRGSGDTPTHRYPQAGTYAVALTVTNDAGQSATTSRAIAVRLGDIVGTCRSKRQASLVACVNSFIHGHDEKSDFEVAKHVAWILKIEGEDGGLLVKPGGENIWSWRGYSFSTSRVCSPLTSVWKIFSDAGAGGANAPIWADNGPTVDTGSVCVPAMDPGLP